VTAFRFRLRSKLVSGGAGRSTCLYTLQFDHPICQPDSTITVGLRPILLAHSTDDCTAVAYRAHALVQPSPRAGHKKRPQRPTLTLDSDSDGRSSDMDADDADSDWEEGRTLVPPDDEDVIKCVRIPVHVELLGLTHRQSSGA